MADATVRLGYNDADLQAGLKRSGAHVRAFEQKTRSSFSGLGAGLRTAFSSALGALGVGSGVAGLKSIIDEIDRAGDLAKQLDVSAESIQRLGYVSKIAGTDLEGAARGLNRINKELAGGKGVDVFKRLGIDLRAFFAADADGQMIMLAKAFQQAERDGRGVAEAYELIGKSASELLPLLRANVSELEAASKIEVIKNADIEKIQKFNDEFDKLVMGFKAGIAQGALAISNPWESLTGTGSGAVGASVGKIAKDMAQIKADAADAAAETERLAEAEKKAADECERFEKLGEAISKMQKEDADAAAKKAETLKKEAVEVAKQRDARLESIRALEGEMEILELLDKGQKKKAAALEKELAIKREAHEIAKATGISEEKALKIAQKRADIKERLDKKAGGSGDRPDGRRPIHGYSNAQRASNPYLNSSRGLDSFWQLQRGPGTLDKNLNTPGLNNLRRLNSLERNNEGQLVRPTAFPVKVKKDSGSKSSEQASRTVEQVLRNIEKNTAPILAG
jgi:hypothetical protein